MMRLGCLGRVRFRWKTVEKTQALFSKKYVNKQQGWVEGRTFVRPGERFRSGATQGPVRCPEGAV
jgi:hypothetical protein